MPPPPSRSEQRLSRLQPDARVIRSQRIHLCRDDLVDLGLHTLAQHVSETRLARRCATQRASEHLCAPER